jgi:hypothetical protein
MKLLSTWFLAGHGLELGQRAASVSGGGRSMAALRAMLRGTMLSIRARREASPITDSMWASSAALDADVAGNEFAGFSSSPGAVQAGHRAWCRVSCINMRQPSGRPLAI